MSENSHKNINMDRNNGPQFDINRERLNEPFSNVASESLIKISST